MKQFILLLTLVLIFGGCITDSGDNSDDLIGLWKSPGNVYSITFRADGSYHSSQWSAGSYKAEGNKLTLRVPATTNRAERVTQYKYYQDGNFLTIVVRENESNMYFDFLRERP